MNAPTAERAEPLARTNEAQSKKPEPAPLPAASMTAPTRKASFSAKPSSKGKSSKIVSTKAEADWLKSLLPSTVEGELGFWSIRPDCAGFAVYFRVKTPTINQRFPRISRQMFLTLKGMSDAERKTTTEKYVRGHLAAAIASGDDRARTVAGKLSLSS